MGGKLTTVTLHELWIYLTGGSLITAIWKYFYYYFNAYVIQPVVKNFIKENTAPAISDAKKATSSNEAANSQTPKRGGDFAIRNKFDNFQFGEVENAALGSDETGNSETPHRDTMAGIDNDFKGFKFEKVKNLDVGSIKNDPKKNK